METKKMSERPQVLDAREGVGGRPEVKILAFLQNPYFHPGTQQRHIDLYATNQRFHRMVLERSATGKALVRAFGRELYDEIVWDNASQAHGWLRGHVSPPDPEHMRRRFVEEKPDVVLLFGKQALTGWNEVDVDEKNLVVLMAPHPMARGSQVDHLAQISNAVKRLVGRAHD